MLFTQAMLANSARVYTDYEDAAPPSHPGKSWTRFICISDTHSRTFSVPEGDVLLHSGDLSSWGHPEQLKFTLAWLCSLTHPIKMYVLIKYSVKSSSYLLREE